ncbi:hypothetical protein AB3K78_15355 [Leucobacter sp. HNU]|uniref:hypothetical protein n=1 Tax=Leucobacter sp. HNU TaxID=3236805 RepID=UPI003A80514D
MRLRERFRGLGDGSREVDAVGVGGVRGEREQGLGEARRFPRRDERQTDPDLVRARGEHARKSRIRTGPELQPEQFARSVTFGEDGRGGEETGFLALHDEAHGRTVAEREVREAQQLRGDRRAPVERRHREAAADRRDALGTGHARVGQHDLGRGPPVARALHRPATDALDDPAGFGQLGRDDQADAHAVEAGVSCGAQQHLRGEAGAPEAGGVEQDRGAALPCGLEHGPEGVHRAGDVGVEGPVRTARQEAQRIDQQLVDPGLLGEGHEAGDLEFDPVGAEDGLAAERDQGRGARFQLRQQSVREPGGVDRLLGVLRELRREGDR